MALHPANLSNKQLHGIMIIATTTYTIAILLMMTIRPELSNYFQRNFIEAAPWFLMGHITYLFAMNILLVYGHIRNEEDEAEKDADRVAARKRNVTRHICGWIGWGLAFLCHVLIAAYGLQQLGMEQHGEAT
ncbi:hypothetical protein PMZ80_007652 [Knufia obscura]|uniref:Uncharacterized protein n=2 Tax=Knufia TaxID=430999 RepID=A0AAN8EMD4_9EURO|nr:hypothetical protein PMZ80_007652 [Knufia obscura]KAK5954192.1 hypothetical protein OHC33_004765 [Knufia fluminis]